MKPIKPRPGRWHGIDFRSQLEIKWAKYLHEREGDFTTLHYDDAAAWDFRIEFPSGRKTYVEIKPKVLDKNAQRHLITQAFERMESEWRPVDSFACCDAWCLILGEPPSVYANPICWRCEFHSICNFVVTPFDGLEVIGIVWRGELHSWSETAWWSISPERRPANMRGIMEPPYVGLAETGPRECPDCWFRHALRR